MPKKNAAIPKESGVHHKLPDDKLREYDFSPTTIDHSNSTTPREPHFDAGEHGEHHAQGRNDEDQPEADPLPDRADRVAVPRYRRDKEFAERQLVRLHEGQVGIESRDASTSQEVELRGLLIDRKSVV